MKKTHIFGLIFVVLVVSIIIFNMEQEGKIVKLTYNIGGCDITNQVRGEYVKSYRQPNIEIQEDTILMTHFLKYVCCANMTIELEQNNNLIKLTEINEGEMCRCICEYNINATIGPLKKGDYTIHVYGVKYKNIEPDLLIEEGVKIK